MKKVLILLQIIIHRLVNGLKKQKKIVNHRKWRPWKGSDFAEFDNFDEAIKYINKKGLIYEENPYKLVSS